MRYISFVATEYVLVAVFAVIAAFSLAQTLSANELGFAQFEIPYSSLLLGVHVRVSGLIVLMVLIFVPAGMLILLHPYFGFWAAAWAGMGLHVPAIIAHNQLEWTKFLGMERIVDPGLNQPETISLIVGSVVILFMIHRLIGHSMRQRLLERQGADYMERYLILRGDIAMTCAMAVLSLVVTVLVISVGGLFSGAEGLFTRLPWMVLTIGLIVLTLTSTFLMTWIHVERSG